MNLLYDLYDIYIYIYSEEPCKEAVGWLFDGLSCQKGHGWCFAFSHVFSMQFCRSWWAHESYNTMPSALKSMEQPHRRRFLRGCDGRPVPARDMSCLLRRRCFLEGPNWGEILTQTHLVLQYRRGQQLLPRQLPILPRTKVVRLEHGCKMAIW